MPSAGDEHTKAETVPCWGATRSAFPVRCIHAEDDRRARWRAVADGSIASEPDADLTAALCREAWGEAAWAENASVEYSAGAESLLVVRCAEAKVEIAADFAAGAGLTLSGRKVAGPEAAHKCAVTLLQMAGAFARETIGGATDDRSALASSLAVWDESTAADRHAVLSGIDSLRIDAGGIFGRFLRSLDDKEAMGDAGDSADEWRQRCITWLLGQARLDLPYDRAAIAETLRANMDPDEARLALYQIVRGYHRGTERCNAERISGESAWSDEELIFGRMSRAFHNQALLFAHARLVTITDEVAAAADDVAECAEPWSNLRPAADRITLLARPRSEARLTELAGALDHLEEQTLRHQRSQAQSALQRRRAQVEAATPDPESNRKAEADLSETMRVSEAILRATGTLRERILEADRRPAAYLIASQRPSPTGSHLLAKINEGREPYLGKAENLRQLVPQAGDRLYASPDYVWLEHADHWIEAIPLFIKERIRVVDGVETTETVIDQAGMEESFREQMAEPWARNLRAAELSGYCAFARALLLDEDPASADLGRAADFDRVRKLTTDGRADETAALAATVKLASDTSAAAISAEFERNGGGERLDAVRRVLLDEYDGDVGIVGDELWQAVLGQVRQSSDWLSGLQSALADASPEVRERHRAACVEMAPLSERPLRRTPAMHVLTTQSANMTDGYVRTWLEESMALVNVVDAEGLAGAVDERLRSYGDEIEALGEALIDELGLGVEVDTMVATEDIPRASAIRRAIGANRLVQAQVSVLAVLREVLGHSNADNAPVDPPEVDSYIGTKRAELEEQALADVVERNVLEIGRAVAGLREQSPDASHAELERRVVDGNGDFTADLGAFVRFAAREALLRKLDEEQPDDALAERKANWLRRHQRLARTTARKEVLSEAGLSHLTLDPRHYYQATGGSKRYHLLYTPSRVDLGPRERESVETWAQWVGGLDRQAAQVGRRVYGLINKSVKRFDSLTEPEVLKTGENASMASHFAYSNAMALMVNAAGRGDVEELGDQMSLREDRTIHPAGEGYGGYCVPKDGLFLEFVLTLSEGVKLGQLGVEDHNHASVARLARKVLLGREDFPTELEWEAWAERMLADEDGLRKAFGIRDADGPSGRQVPVFQITRLASVLERLGQPPLTNGRAVVGSLAARFGVHTMIAGAEHVNRFMPFYKVWLTYDALANAHRENDRLPTPENAKIVLSAEYKPDTQDGRFSVGMRKFEIYAGTGEFLRYSLGGEARTLAALMIDGWDRTVDALGADDSQLRRIAARWGLAPNDGSEQLRDVFPGYPAPGELRLVSPMGLSTQDVLRYTSDTTIEDVAEDAKAELYALGLDDEDIVANMTTFGPRLERWARLRGDPAASELAGKLGGYIHAMALSVLGPDNSYEHALQGADVFDVGISHRQVMELLARPAELRDLMLYGHPDSSLIIVDGGSGARRRAMSRYDVMRWFAACEQVGKKGVYRAIGVGEDTVESWRLRMQVTRDEAKGFRERYLAGDPSSVAAHFARLVATARDEQEALLALEEEERLTRFRRDTEAGHVVSAALADISRMRGPEEFGFVHWLGAGGAFITEGLPESDLAREEALFAGARKKMFGVEPSAGDTEPTPSAAAAILAPPMRQAGAPAFRQEGGVESSNKATEEVTSIALDTRKQLAERARRMVALHKRRRAFDETLDKERGAARPAAKLVDDIRATLGDPEGFETDEAFGRMMALTRILAESMVAELCDDLDEAAELSECFRALFGGMELDPDALRSVCGGYEEIGALGNLGQNAIERARGEKWPKRKRLSVLESVATLAEFVDIARALDATLADRQGQGDEPDAGHLWRSLATFFSETINDHFDEYRPWAYSRGIGFDEFHDDELYDLADRHHRWLYGYLRNLVVTRTEAYHRPVTDQDLLLGRLESDVAIGAIGAGGTTDAERRWRAYGQLREIAFLRNDGFVLPPVFDGFGPSLVDARHRVNLVALYPVGRTHISRMLAEGPTLARELVADGQPAANILLTRQGHIRGDRIEIDDAHLYVERGTYTAALRMHWGLSESGAEAIADRDVGPKGVRIAARFSEPVTAAVVLPMHGSEVYDGGHLERLGLPFSIQSRYHTWTTYDKAKYADIFTPDTGVTFPDEIDWLHEWTTDSDEPTVLEHIKRGRPDSSFEGLISFARQHRIVMVKDAAESGGRRQKAFEIGAPDGTPIDQAVDDAAEFLYQISLHHNVAVQEVIVSSPEAWATEGFLERFTDRQITDWSRPIVRDRQPLTPLFGSFRIILSTDRPQAEDRERHWHVSHKITLNSTQLITNIGRGGTLEILRPSDIRPEFRSSIIDALEDAGRKTMEAMSAYENQTASEYEEETGDAIGCDLTGVSYGVPRYLMLDFLLRPVFDRPGELVEIAPDLDESETRVGSLFMLHDGSCTFEGKIVDWQVILIEPNIGVGLWDRVAIREEERERERAAAAGEPMNWDRVGENARIVLRDLTRAGTEYMTALRDKSGR